MDSRKFSHTQDTTAPYQVTGPATYPQNVGPAPYPQPQTVGALGTNAHIAPPRMHELIKSDRRMFSASDDSAMMKQIQSTHAPDGRDVDVKPILQIIEDILHHASPNIDGALHGTPHGQMDALEFQTSSAGFDVMLEALSYIINKISCEIACKCSGGTDAHTTTMALFNTLSSYSWDAKVVISLAAFAVNYGQFWLVTQLCTTNPLAKSIALLKQLPELMEHSNSLKPQFDALNKLIKAILNVTKCIVQFKDLPSQYISLEASPLSIAMAHMPTAAYWTIRSIVACASQITNLIGLRHEYIASTTEAWELSSLAHKMESIYEHLTKQLMLCSQHIDEKRHDEAYHLLVRLFETIHMDNMRILKALLCPNDDLQALVEGTTKTKHSIEVLRRKIVLLLVSDLDLSHEEIMILDLMHKESRARPEIQYELVWIPIVDNPHHEANQRKFQELQSVMPWYTVHHPSQVQPAVKKYIKEAWHFTKKAILVSLSPQGRVECLNALHMLWIWGNLAFPFSNEREELLWKSESWRLELIVDGIDPTILDWAAAGKYTCLYGGEDLEWIRKFTSTAKAVAKAAGITLEMVYVGKSNTKERVRRNIATISSENLSHYWPDLTSIWFFWARLESMLYSKLQHGKTVEHDHVMQEVMTTLSFDGSDVGWAIICKGSAEIARGKAESVLASLLKFNEWEEEARDKGFVPAFIEHLQLLHTPQHCNRLILPGINGNIPERVVCAECGRAMEKYLMYRCCTE